MGDGAREHAFEVRREGRAGGARLCAEFVTACLFERGALDPPPGHGYGLEAHLEACQLGPEREPGLRGLPDAASLLRADGLEWVAEAGPASCLHLADDDRTTAPDHDVELVAAGPGVRGQNPIAPQAIVAADPPLGLRPEPP
jgi:hypothetical protein